MPNTLKEPAKQQISALIKKKQRPQTSHIQTITKQCLSKEKPFGRKIFIHLNPVPSTITHLQIH